MQYIDQLGEPTPPEAEKRCFLCDAAGDIDPSRQMQPDAQRLVLVNDDRGLLVLNRFPYTSGHLLAAPRAHLGDLLDMPPEGRAGLMELVVLAERLVKTAYNPQGINIGMNLGRCAGAGLPGHLHVHIVPRWGGDTNFMQVVGEVRVVPQSLEQSFAQLHKALLTLQP